MRARLRSRRSILLALLLTLTVSGRVWGDWQLTWKRIEVNAHLDNAGALQVSERMSVALAGEMTSLERKLGASTDQAIVLQRLVREEAGGEREFVDGGFDEKWRYMWRDGTLTWWIRDNADPHWDGQTVVFRLDYELRYALAPAWDIAAGPKSFRYSAERFPLFFGRLRSTIFSWRYALRTFDRRFRLDHDVLFPSFPATGPEELNYTLRYDDAWRREYPLSEIGRGTPESDYRVMQLFDYLRPGWPPAIELWRPATRVGSIFGFAALAGILWVIYAAGAIRRFGVLAPRLNRQWFEQQIVAQSPEFLARLLGKGRGGIGPFLARLRTRGVISVRTDPPANEETPATIHLQLLREDPALQPYERQMIRALFPRGPQSGSAVLAQHYAKDGFDPEEAFAEAFDEQLEEAGNTTDRGWVRRSLFWEVIHRLAPLLFWGAVVLLLVDLFYDQRPMGLIFTCFALAAVVAGLPQLIFRFETPISGGSAALITLLALGVAMLTIVVLQFYENLPLSPRGSAGLALFALWCVVALLYSAQPDDRPAWAMAKRNAFLGARYVRKELRKSHPALDDSWMPHLAALGLDSAIERWRKRPAATGSMQFPLPVNSLAGLGGTRAFTGTSPPLEETEWVDGLVVYPEEERREAEEDERADAQET